MILMCEHARLMMKTHSYLRNKLLYGIKENIKYAEYLPDIAKKKGLTVKDLNNPEISIGDFETEISRFTYFLLAPTLLYRYIYINFIYLGGNY
jgi:sterol O-acyltransferase